MGMMVGRQEDDDEDDEEKEERENGLRSACVRIMQTIHVPA